MPNSHQNSGFDRIIPVIKILITGISLEKDCGSKLCMASVLGLAYIPVPLLLKGVLLDKLPVVLVTNDNVPLRL